MEPVVRSLRSAKVVIRLPVGLLFRHVFVIPGSTHATGCRGCRTSEYLVKATRLVGQVY